MTTLVSSNVVNPAERTVNQEAVKEFGTPVLRLLFPQEDAVIAYEFNTPQVLIYAPADADPYTRTVEATVHFNGRRYRIAMTDTADQYVLSYVGDTDTLWNEEVEVFGIYWNGNTRTPSWRSVPYSPVTHPKAPSTPQSAQSFNRSGDYPKWHRDDQIRGVGRPKP